MEELSQEYILSIAFSDSIKREELLLKKCEGYYDTAKNKDLKDMLKIFKKTSREHIDTMKDKMIKLKIQG